MRNILTKLAFISSLLISSSLYAGATFQPSTGQLQVTFKPGDPNYGSNSYMAVVQESVITFYVWEPQSRQSALCFVLKDEDPDKYDHFSRIFSSATGDNTIYVYIYDDSNTCQSASFYI